MTLTQGYRFAYGLKIVDPDVMLLTRDDKMSLANMVLVEGYNSAWVSCHGTLDTLQSLTPCGNGFTMLRTTFPYMMVAVDLGCFLLLAKLL